MNLYDVALAIFLKKQLPQYVTDTTRKQLVDGAADSIEAAKLFLRACCDDETKSKAPLVLPAEPEQLELPFGLDLPEDEL